MIIATSQEVKLGRASIYRGPLFTIDSLGALVVRTFPEQWWPWAIATAFAETGLETPITVDGKRRRELVAWSGAIGDLHLTDKTWGPSVGLWQMRQSARTAQDRWPLDPATNASAASVLLESAGPRRWASHTSGRNRVHLPTAHRWVAQWCDAHPTGRSK